MFLFIKMSNVILEEKVKGVVELIVDERKPFIPNLRKPYIPDLRKPYIPDKRNYFLEFPNKLSKKDKII